MGCSACERSLERTDILTEKITSYEQLYDAVKKGHKLVVFEDMVIDLNTFLRIHPGGTEMFKTCVGIFCSFGVEPTEHKKILKKGTEISRYFYGGFKYKSKEVHHHSESAMQLLANLSVGCIKTGLKQKIFRSIKPQPEDGLDKEVWKLVGKKMITSVHAVFQFRSPNYKVAGMLPYFDHCGRYYTV